MYFLPGLHMAQETLESSKIQERLHLKCGLLMPSLYVLFQSLSAHGANESCAADVALFRTLSNYKPSCGEHEGEGISKN